MKQCSHLEDVTQQIYGLFSTEATPDNKLIDKDYVDKALSNIQSLDAPFTSQIQLNATTDNIQEVIDNIPKNLNAYVTINMTQGVSTNTKITIEYFRGIGIISIMGIQTGGVYPSIGSMAVQYNSLTMIISTGLIATTPNVTSFEANNCFSMVQFNSCSSDVGVKNNIANIGIKASNCGFIFVTGCSFSNKYYATYIQRARAGVFNLSGVENTIAYYASSSSIIHIENDGTISASVLYNKSYGGIIVKADSSLYFPTSSVAVNLTDGLGQLTVEKSGNVVNILPNSGVTSTTISAGKVVGTVPVGYRPTYNRSIHVIGDVAVLGTGVNTMVVHPDGTITSTKEVPLLTTFMMSGLSYFL